MHLEIDSLFQFDETYDVLVAGVEKVTFDCCSSFLSQLAVKVCSSSPAVGKLSIGY